MAHPVQCKICGKKFDRDIESAVRVSGNRYAHKSCLKGNEIILEPKTKAVKEIPDLIELHKYLKELFKENYNHDELNKQIKYHIDHNKDYTYSGILKTLHYWYDVKNNSTDKSNYRIGIVPYIYQDAYNYYKSIYLAQQINIDKNIEDYKPKVQEVKIKQPQRNPIVPKLFDLDN